MIADAVKCMIIVIMQPIVRNFSNILCHICGSVGMADHYVVRNSNMSSCYFILFLLSFDLTFASYFHVVVVFPFAVAISNGEWGGPGSCSATLCECDRALSNCLRRFYCPRKRAVCTSSPLRLLQNLLMDI